MTPDERATQLRAELAALGVPANDITHRLLDRVDHYTRAVDLDCMEAVDTILALRDQIVAYRTIVQASDAENARLQAAIETARQEVDEIKIRLEMILGPMRKAVANA
ncbi:MAG: hypothetical protein OEV43_00535 [Coriobacteriia bacterium]|nr:hypothetical protein [Coriobacteriia bacterium]